MSVRKQKGFTVLEMLIVLSIGALLAAFAIPGFQDMSAKNRVNSYAQEVTNMMALARNASVTNRRSVVMQRSGTGWEVRFDNATGTLLSQQQSTPETVQFTIVPGDFARVVFDPTGYATVQPTNMTATSPLVIALCDSGSTREMGRNITVTRIGRVSSVQHTTPTTCNP